MVSLVIACGVTVLIASMLLFSNALNNAMRERLRVAINIVEHEIEEIKARAYVAAIGVANNPTLINALKNNDRDALIVIANRLAELLQVDYCTILDNEGTVIKRTHAPDRYDDNIAHLPQVRSALAGKTGAHIIQGPIVRLGISAGRPIFDDDMNMIGIVSLGFRLDTPDVTERLRNLTGCEITLYMNDERVSSTLLNEDGTDILGTTAGECISDLVLNGTPLISRKKLFGNDVLALYVPLFGEDDVIVGMLFAGYYVVEDISRIWALALYGTLITLVVLAVCIILARFLIVFVESKLQFLLDNLKNRDEMLQSTNDFLHLLYGNAPVGMITIDKDFIVTDCNDNLLTMLGVTKLNYDDLVNNNLPEYQSDGIKSKEKIFEIIERAHDGHGQTLEWEYKSASGETIPCEITVTYAVHEGKPLALSYVYDLRQTKKMEDQIFQLELKAEKIYYDALTEIYNRRYFDENINIIMKSLSRSAGTLSLMMIDIDYFKKYNDTYGHSEGDVCLKSVATAFSECMKRKGDFVARCGGEEFIVVLPNTDEAGARIVAERLLQSTRELAIPHKASDVENFVTVSIGVTTGTVNRTLTADDFVKRADEMLYTSKQNGRNRYSFGRF